MLGYVVVEYLSWPALYIVPKHSEVNDKVKAHGDIYRFETYTFSGSKHSRMMWRK